MQALKLIPTLEPKPYKPRCKGGSGHRWQFVDTDHEITQCGDCGCMSSNWNPVAEARRFFSQVEGRYGQAISYALVGMEESDPEAITYAQCKLMDWRAR